MVYDLAVAWRIYPGVSKTPLIHQQDKFQLVKTCLLSFVKSLPGLSVKYYIILDGCPEAYTTLIQELLAGKAYEIISTNRIGNLKTFALQIDLLIKQTDAEYVYFAEDDYLYKPGEFVKMYNLIKTGKGVDFVTAYFSTDIYNHPIHNHPHTLRYTNEQLWLSSSSTCLTFLTSRRILQQTKGLFSTYCKGNNDCAIWLILTKTHILNPLQYIRFYRLPDKECYNIMKMTIKYSFRYFFSRRLYKLWVPYPGIGTHLETGLIVQPKEWIALAEKIDH